MGVEDQGCEDCACWEGEAWWDRDQVWGSERGEEEGEGEDSDQGGVERVDGCEEVGGAMTEELLCCNGPDEFATGCATKLSDRSYSLHLRIRHTIASMRKTFQFISYTEVAKRNYAT